MAGLLKLMEYKTRSDIVLQVIAGPPMHGKKGRIGAALRWKIIRNENRAGNKAPYSFPQT